MAPPHMISIMTAKRIDASLKIAGAFWSPLDPDTVFTGDVISKRGRLTFVVAPTFKRIDQRKAIFEVMQSMESPTGFPKLKILCGETSDGPCTLLHLLQVQDRGVINLGRDIQISAPVWKVSAVIVGLHLATADADELESAVFSYSKINEIFQTPWEILIKPDEITYSYPREAREIVRFSSLALKAEIAIQVYGSRRDKPRKRMKMHSNVRIRVTPDTAKSLEWYTELSSRLENFFSLLIGTSVSLESTLLRKGSDEGSLIRRKPTHDEESDAKSVPTFSESQLAVAISRWLAVPQAELPLEKTLLGMVRVSDLFLETEFLSLAQSIEAFGRLHFKDPEIPSAAFETAIARVIQASIEAFGDTPLAARCSGSLKHVNEPSFPKRLKATYDLLSPSFAKKLLGHKSEFVRSVADTRNYFTHLGIDKERWVIVEAKPLFLLNQKLQALLRCVLLLKLGFIESAILRHISKWL